MPRRDAGANYAQGFEGYGYQWWLPSLSRGDFVASGKDGQFLYVDPARDVVIVRQGWELGTGMTYARWVRFFQDLADEVARPPVAGGTS